MKQILIIATAALMAGCVVPYDVVKEHSSKCAEKGGQTIIIVWPDRTVKTVNCEIGGVTYRMGDY